MEYTLIYKHKRTLPSVPSFLNLLPKHKEKRLRFYEENNVERSSTFIYTWYWNVESAYLLIIWPFSALSCPHGDKIFRSPCFLSRLLAGIGRLLSTASFSRSPIAHVCSAVSAPSTRYFRAHPKRTSMSFSRLHRLRLPSVWRRRRKRKRKFHSPTVCFILLFD